MSEERALAIDNGIEKALIMGDLASLDSQARINYVRAICESLGLNPLTQPFSYITLNGKLVLYAKRDATDQLRRLHGITIQLNKTERVEDVYVVTAEATDKSGRTDTSTGAVSIKGLSGDALANALMKAETKAKRRVTLSIVGLGFLDETEIETIPTAKPVNPIDAAQEIPYTSSPAAQEKIDAKAPPHPPNGNPRNRRMAELVRLGTEWYGEGALTFAMKNHIKKVYDLDSSAAMTDAQIEEQITEFGRRIDARKAELAMQPGLAPFSGEDMEREVQP
jgi:hypothetical protein